MTPFEEYERKVASVFAEYVSVRDSSSLVWSTTNPYPTPARCGNDWRFLSNIEEYNARAHDVAGRFGVAEWDTYSVLKHVFDRNYDKGHYRFPDALWPSLAALLLEKEREAFGASGGACPRLVRVTRRDVTELDLQTSLQLLQEARDVWNNGRTGEGGEGGLGGVVQEEEAREVVVQQVVAACCEAMMALPDYARRFALGVALNAEGDDWQAVRMLKASHRAAPGFLPARILLGEVLDLEGLSGDGGDQLQGLIPAEIQDDLFGSLLRRLASLPQVERILEVGSGGGAGSTAALLSGISRRAERGGVEMHCIEVSSVRVQQLRKRLAASQGGYELFVHHAVSVPPSTCLAAHQLHAFGSLRSQLSEEDRAVFDLAWNLPSGDGGAGGAGETELEKLVRGAEDRVYGERAFLAQAGVDLTGPDGIAEVLWMVGGSGRVDLALLDGSDLCGDAELAAVWGANIVALDDTLGVKHLGSRVRLLACQEYLLLEEDTRTRNGFAIFVRRAWEHATLVVRARDRQNPSVNQHDGTT